RWIHQECERKPACVVSRVARDDGRKISARAITRSRDALRIDAELFGMLERIARAGDRVVDRRRKSIFRSATIVEREHANACAEREPATQTVVRDHAAG